MDPQAALKGLLSALAEHDWDTVRELANALKDWLDRDGFAPVTLGAESLGREWHIAIARLTCDMAIARARTESRKESVQ